MRRLPAARRGRQHQRVVRELCVEVVLGSTARRLTPSPTQHLILHAHTHAFPPHWPPLTPAGELQALHDKSHPRIKRVPLTPVLAAADKK